MRFLCVKVEKVFLYYDGPLAGVCHDIIDESIKYLFWKDREFEINGYEASPHIVDIYCIYKLPIEILQKFIESMSNGQDFIKLVGGSGTNFDKAYGKYLLGYTTSDYWKYDGRIR